MLATRTFNVVLISPRQPVAFSFTPLPGKSVQYHGDAIDMRFE
jgi:hypothetical protein